MIFLLPERFLGKRDLPNHRKFFHGTRVESDKFHLISPCMGCTCPVYENNISVRAKMSGLSTIKGDALTILSDAFCFFNWTFFLMQHRC